MTYSDLLLRLRAGAAGFQVREYGAVVEGGLRHPLLELTLPGGPELVITAGFHGDEKSGPLTLGARLPDIRAMAEARGVALRVYPCINPGGFEAHSRYNPSGEHPNNDLLRYSLRDGSQVDTLRDLGTMTAWEVYRGGPKETQALRTELEAGRSPAAALDLHQDNYLPGSGTYAYCFGELAPYAALMSEGGRLAPILRNAAVDENTRTDPLGLIVFHDGSVTDYFWRRGVPYVAALETTTATAPDACEQINLIWIRGFIELAARARVA